MFMPKQARHLHVSLICLYTGETSACRHICIDRRNIFIGQVSSFCIVQAPTGEMLSCVHT